jgi:hypothetical protein
MNAMQLFERRYSLNLNVQLSDAGWCQAILPVNKGGLGTLGIRAAPDIALPALLSYVVGTSHLLPDRLSNVSGLNDESYICTLAGKLNRDQFTSATTFFKTESME